MALKAAAEYASLSERTLRQACQEPDPGKRLTSYKVAGAYLVRVSELDAWILRHRVPSPDLDAIVREMTQGLDGPSR